MNLPDAFIEEMISTLGAAETDKLAAALTTEPPVSVRLNPEKNVRLTGAAEGVPWSSTGYYLTARPAFTFDPLLHAGCYYVQEAASMFIEQAFRAIDSPPRRVLDLCAAPGGKSTLWRSLLDDDCLLVANEPLRTRAAILSENMLKWGHPNVCVTSGYPSQFAPPNSVNSTSTTAENITDIFIAQARPFCARFSFPAPIFCPVNVETAALSEENGC